MNFNIISEENNNKLLERDLWLSWWKIELSDASHSVIDIETRTLMTLDRKLIKIRPSISKLLEFISTISISFYIQKDEDIWTCAFNNEKYSIGSYLEEALVDLICKI